MPARELQVSDVPRSPADAAEFVKKTLGQKPQQMVHAGDLPATARALRDVLASCRYLFEREVPVKLVQPRDGGPMRAVPLTANNVVIEAHDLCQPGQDRSPGRACCGHTA